MRQPLLALLPNRVRRNYAGGRCLDEWEDRGCPQDGAQPEDWLASTTPAINRGMPEVLDEGLGRVIDRDGNHHALAELFARHADYYLGSEHLARVGLELGFLAKLLDSSMRLHTQVHPKREFAQAHLGSRYGKLECYVILAVRPEHPGILRLGFQHAPTRERWREIVEKQDMAAMDACFDPVPVQPGQVWLVPGGMVHALGAGLLLLEVMEPSDLVVRCEFTREGIVVPPEARYMGRDLDFCLGVFDYTEHTPAEVEKMCRLEPALLSRSAMHEERLALSFAQTRCFEVHLLRVFGCYDWPAAPFGRLVVVAKGEGIIRSGEDQLKLKPGARFFVAAAADGSQVVSAEGSPLELCVCQATGGVDEV